MNMNLIQFKSEATSPERKKNHSNSQFSKDLVILCLVFYKYWVWRMKGKLKNERGTEEWKENKLTLWVWILAKCFPSCGKTDSTDCRTTSGNAAKYRYTSSQSSCKHNISACRTTSPKVFTGQFVVSEMNHAWTVKVTNNDCLEKTKERRRVYATIRSKTLYNEKRFWRTL